MFNISKDIRRYLVFFVSIIIVFPYYYGFPHLFVNSHDNLDVDVIRYMLGAREKYLFASNDKIIPEMMCGLPRKVFDSEFYYPYWLFYFFHPYKAVLINLIIVHFIGFWSAYLLGEYILLNKNYKSWFVYVLILLTSIAFTYFNEQHLLNLGIGIAMSPLVTRSFLKIYYQEYKWWDYLIIFIFPFGSRLIHTGFFWLFFLVSIFIILYFYEKKFRVELLIGIILMGAGYIIVEYRLLWAMIIEHFQSHRYEFNLNKLTTQKMFNRMLEYLMWGDYQARALNFVFLILMIGGLCLILIKRLKMDKKYLNMIVFFILLWLFSSVISPLTKYKYTREIFSYVNYFDFSRFAFMLPVIGLTLLYFWIYVLMYLTDKQWQKKVRVYSFIAILIGLMASIKYNHTIKDVIKRNLHFGKSEINNNEYFYLDEFYATDLFEKIKQDLPKDRDKYRVASVGLLPAMALFNGFYTIDGIIANYPLAYKKKFRKIIEKEIEMNTNLKDYFDDYGCSVLLFTKDLTMKHQENFRKNEYIYPQFNTQFIKLLNCKYIFSSVKIGNADTLGWRFLKHYQNKNFNIYLYEVL